MSRSYGRIACSIWDDDDDFAALSAGAQRTYLMLATQKDVSACGTLALTVKRWAGRMRADDRASLPGWLTELQASAFVRIDDDTEEVLIRTFIKWDGGYTNGKRLLAIHGVSKALRSPMLRAILASEMVKLGLEPQFVIPDSVFAGEYPIEGASDSPSDTGSDSSRVVVTNSSSSTTTLKPESTTLDPGAVASGKPNAPAPKSKPARTRIPENFEVTPDMIRWARERCPNITQPFLDLCTRKFVDHFENATRNAMKVNWRRTWENWVESDYQQHPTAPSRPTLVNGGRSTTDDKVAATLAMAARYAAEDEAQQRLEITR